MIKAAGHFGHMFPISLSRIHMSKHCGGVLQYSCNKSVTAPNRVTGDVLLVTQLSEQGFQGCCLFWQLQQFISSTSVALRCSCKLEPKWPTPDSSNPSPTPMDLEFIGCNASHACVHCDQGVTGVLQDTNSACQLIQHGRLIIQ